MYDVLRRKVLIEKVLSKVHVYESLYCVSKQVNKVIKSHDRRHSFPPSTNKKKRA